MASNIRTLKWLSVATLVTCVAAACAGKAGSSADSDAGSASDAGREGGVGGNAPGCPDTLPAQDSACQKSGLLCEYGADFNPACNKVVVCSGGRWASPISFGGGAACPTTFPTLPPNPSDCSATRAAVPVGTKCSTSSTCSYDGSKCMCGSACPNFPVRQRDCDPDAGITTNCCDASPKWFCYDGPPVCPSPRPRVGSACAEPGKRCAVGEPAECGQAVLECQAGIWNTPNTTCPISSRRMKDQIRYIDEPDAKALQDQLMSLRLATYRYKSGDPTTHLGFIIEDMPEGSPAVLASRERVDLYGYVSMAVATIQRQEREIADLEARMDTLEKRAAPRPDPQRTRATGEAQR